MSPNETAIILDRYTINENGCWIWTFGRSHFGHGRIKIRGKTKLAHRISWEYHKGPIPDGLFVCHKCDNPPCINPDHLFVGTQKDNLQDMKTKGRSVNSTGSNNGASKLNEIQVREIKNLLYERRYTHEEIAGAYDVNRATISQIAIGKNWSHIMSVLYNLHTDGTEWRITKFVDGNPEASYLTTHSECQCPAGHRHTCRHRQMLPEMLAAGLENSHYFWDFDRHMAFDISGNAKHLLDALAATKPAPTLEAEGNDQDTLPPLPEGVQMFNLAETSPAELFNAIAEAVGEPTHPTPAKPWRRL